MASPWSRNSGQQLTPNSSSAWSLRRQNDSEDSDSDSELDALPPWNSHTMQQHQRQQQQQQRQQTMPFSSFAGGPSVPSNPSSRVVPNATSPPVASSAPIWTAYRSNDVNDSSDSESESVASEETTMSVRRQRMVDNFKEKYEEWVVYDDVLSRADKRSPFGGTHGSSDTTNEVIWQESDQVYLRNLLLQELRMTRGGTAIGTCATIKVKGQNSIQVESSDLKHHFPSLSLKHLADVLFCPGMKYRGTIRIPGLGQNRARSGNSDPIMRLTEMVNRLNELENDVLNFGRIDTGFSTTTSSDSSAAATAITSKDNVYELVVLERGTDALGNHFIFAQHRAYEDEQCVNIRMILREERCNDSGNASNVLEVEYADGETVCKGVWNPSECRFEGHVRQRSYDDGFFHESDEVTHVFTLYPCTNLFPAGRHGMDEDVLSESLKAFERENYQSINSALGFGVVNTGGQGVESNPQYSIYSLDLMSIETKAISSHRHRTYRTIFSLLHQFHDLVEGTDIDKYEMNTLRMRWIRGIGSLEQLAQHDEKLQALCQLRHINWKGLITISTINVERMCAEFRRRAAVLANATFETSKDRSDYLAKWKHLSMDLKGSHADWSRSESMVVNVVNFAPMFDESVMGSMDTGHLMVLHARLSDNYNRLDKAFRGARSRLPQMFFSQFEFHVDCKKFGKETNCPICQSSLLESEYGVEDEVERSPLYKLPCSHCFHGQCVQQWLRDHSSCPICRAELGKG